MNNNENNDKLDWMYKSANSLVDREEYLLGRSIDKTLEQLNAEEKEKKLGIVPPKNHVEHECIPPSIRDFNKVVQVDQVDINAKLQEDPLVTIKKREEEVRREFLQNPVQLKKLQEALKIQESKKKKSKQKRKKSGRDSDSDLDRKITKKLKYLKGGALPSLKKKKKDDSALDTILMYKFNELKDRLSQEDLDDILAGNVSDSDEEVETKGKKLKRRRNSSSDESDHRRDNSEYQRERRRRSPSDDRSRKKRSNKTRDSSDSIRMGKVGLKRNINIGGSKDEAVVAAVKLESRIKGIREMFLIEKKKSLFTKKTFGGKSRRSSSEDSGEDKARGRKRRPSPDKRKEQSGSSITKDLITVDDELENKILQKLRMLRNSSKSKRSDSAEADARERSDSDEPRPKPRTFGLVKADGTKIALNKKLPEVKKTDKIEKAETVTKQEKKNVKKLTEEDKERLRKEMMQNAEKRDKERSDNLKRYREEDKREEKNAANFDKDFLHKQLVRSTKEATVESRIKSNLNNIQRSSKHMSAHFSKR
ncbi:hypothetical protein NQ315_015788 [Exocentrus adspersus]|uniref:Uncharacterized protein n=1 Tax=Exocentrus adspersus TaxID=1586481 RepID=A0AAV8W496_9CUCU|nr:hypothetical protein NQ315_015788 [Exocentrus adspersus]